MISFDPAVAVNALADRFWEAILEQHPTTATVYGDDRFDDRLDDPSPAGRAAARALRDATLAELAAIPARRPPRRGADHPRHAAGRLRARRTRATTCGWTWSGLVDQIDGPQSLLPRGVQFQPADTPARLEKLLDAPGRVRAVHRGPSRPARGGPRDGDDRPPDRGRAHDLAGRAAPRHPGGPVADRHGGPPGRRRRRGTRPRGRGGARRRQPRPGPLRRGAPRPVPRGDAARRRASGPPRTGSPATGWRSGPGRASTWTRRRCTRSVSRSWPPSTPTGWRSPAPAGSTPSPRTAPTSPPTPPTRHRRRRTWSAGRTMTSPAPWRSRPHWFGRLPVGVLRCPSGRAVHGARRAARLLLPADDRRQPAGRSTSSTPTTCRHASSRSSPPRPTTRRSRATTSRSPWRWSIPACRPSGVLAAG